MKLPKLRELGEVLKSLCSRPFTNMYPFRPVTVPDGFRGKPEYDEKECVGCLACEEVCPGRAIDHVDSKEEKLRVITHHQDHCIFCQQCERACITEKGIKLTKEFELARYDRKGGISQSRKELVICQHCGEIVAPLDHLKFLAKKVGALLYTNPTLLLARHAELNLLSREEVPVNSPHPRAGHLQFICPNCRREMIVKEQW
jgi:hydrogenase-4 component H